VKPRVYVETSIVSYLGARPSRHSETSRRQDAARHWWDQERQKYELVAADIVRVEATRGDPAAVERRLAVLAEVALLPLDDEILVLASKLLAPGGIPKEAEVDAVHVAAASIYRCEYLLTWNLRHIANAQIRRTLERILKAYGYPVPTICTPETLF
jgi:hypothetical protein